MSTVNIIVGLQAENTIKIAPYGGAEEDAKSLGLVKGGISIEHEQTQQEIMVDQYLGPVEQITTAESLNIKTTLAEGTLGNLAAAMGKEYTEGEDLDLGAVSTNAYHTLYINVKGQDNKKRTYTFWKCKINGKTTQAYKRDGETVADIEFNVLIDPAKPAARRFGFVTETEAV
ncbi:hypothetical protein Dip510_001935 [Elusimicrobium posterum]|uniref:hypothetical protein n=1 Tax=Elusimicrobium posterum TaxID=3116653 RepID=UPI003C795D0A